MWALLVASVVTGAAVVLIHRLSTAPKKSPANHPKRVSVPPGSSTFPASRRTAEAG